MSEFDLESYLRLEGAEVEAALERASSEFEDVLPADQAAAGRHGVLSGGKRLRPILCATAFRACGGRASAPVLYDFAVAIELIHAYSLIHDDLPSMDDADLRRGAPTTHRVHGVEPATLAGVALIPLAARRALVAGEALGLAVDTRTECARLLADAAGAAGMVGGQGLDLLGEGKALGTEQLTELHRHKTGALLTAALEIGAVAADASPSVRAALRTYGARVGLAFQIADDVLDATSTAEQLGKRPSDAELEKSTYVALHGLHGARSLALEEAEAAVSALEHGGVDAPALVELADFIVTRRR